MLPDNASVKIINTLFMHSASHSILIIIIRIFTFIDSNLKIYHGVLGFWGFGVRLLDCYVVVLFGGQ